MASIKRHFETNQLLLEFNDGFKLESIPDDLLVSILSHVERQLFTVATLTSCAILRRISDNKVVKSTISNRNREDINQMFQQHHGNDTYDVIISDES